jgi:hypothetical protein
MWGARCLSLANPSLAHRETLGPFISNTLLKLEVAAEKTNEPRNSKGEPARKVRPIFHLSSEYRLQKLYRLEDGGVDVEAWCLSLTLGPFLSDTMLNPETASPKTNQPRNPKAARLMY